MRAIIGIVLLSAPACADFRVGFAERDITPELGMEMPGNYFKQYGRKLHDPCKVRAAVFDDGKNIVALVGVDTLAIHRETVLAARKLIKEKTGIADVLIAASHTHSGGPAGMIMPKEYDFAPEDIRKLAYEHSSCADPKYLAKLETALAEAATAAHETRAVSTAGVGRGKAEGVAYNRRFKMRGGGTFTHPGQGNPDILEPAGPVDPEVGVLGVWNAEGKLAGCVVNFACHATTGPGGISADYVYYIEKVIRGYYGDQVIVVFLNGASGDITQVDNRNPHKQPTGAEWAQRVGGRVGAEALKVLIGLDRGALTPVTAKSEVLTMKRRTPSVERVKAAAETVKVFAKGPEWIFAKETVMIDVLARHAPTVTAEIQAVQIGPAVFLTTPAEYFCQLGLDQKARSNFPFTFPVSLANGCVGYVPTEEAFGPDGGGYETRLTSHSNLVITAGTTFRDTGLTLAKSLTPGPAPKAPKPPLWSGNSWGYGSNKPEKN